MQKGQVLAQLDSIIKNANFKFIFLSYNNEGLLDLSQIKAIFEKYGIYSFITQKYQRFKADSNRTQRQDSTMEYLHILVK